MLINFFANEPSFKLVLVNTNPLHVKILYEPHDNKRLYFYVKEGKNPALRDLLSKIYVKFDLKDNSYKVVS